MPETHPLSLHDPSAGAWLHFEHPRRVIIARRLEEVLPALREIEAAVEQAGLYAAGYISYEAAPAFDAALVTRPSAGFPLLWFGLYSQPQRTTTLPPAQGSYSLEKWQPSVSRTTYNAAIAQIKARIAQGLTYQVNYTFRLRNRFSGDARALFVDMVNSQVPGYSAYLDTGAHLICSASPELFFRLDGNTVTCRPMKGTARRGRTLSEDKAQAAWLKASIKNRAENVMIVDMLRNDLGRLAEIGSVRVPELFVTERYPSLWQMTTSLTAEVRASFTGLLASLFPCGSITGAPKVSTTRIIAALEGSPRKVYTGAIGYLAPGRKAQFNVAIRTVLIEKETGTAEYGVGGGIVWDSTQKDEYAEALLKARLLTSPRPSFSLLETLRWTPAEGFFLLERHLQRLADSAEYFAFPFDLEHARADLLSTAQELTGPSRVRLLLDRDGGLSHQTFSLELPGPARPLRLGLAMQPVDSADVYLFHKTTWRKVHETARSSRPDCDDVILYNERGELTETGIANLVFELDGVLVTPPLECGLLAGTFRAHLLEAGTIREQVLTLADLPRCTKIYTINSVRGWQESTLTIRS
ncbi:MAG TPA: aminodeoxychorismate synthase component I [Anaerolineales bacterium]|jgi:para-aminobenzoate synthetase/4-amino-4-deoxychorismate lyase